MVVLKTFKKHQHTKFHKQQPVAAFSTLDGVYFQPRISTHLANVGLRPRYHKENRVCVCDWAEGERESLQHKVLAMINPERCNNASI